MSVSYDEQTGKVYYQLNLNNQACCNLNNLVGKEIRISFSSKKLCLGCQCTIRGRTYSQGYCYSCFISLPQTDMCMLKPEQCHYQQGTCRDSKWGEKNCFVPHYLYLANTGSLKIGITRNLPTRWIDQGASQAAVIGIFPSRFEVGKAEKKLSQILKDKTSWQGMLKAQPKEINLLDSYKLIYNYLNAQERRFLKHPEKSYKFIYPIQSYPQKITSLKLDRCVFINQVLCGIKGQYLIFENQVINLRAHGGYEIEFSY